MLPAPCIFALSVGWEQAQILRAAGGDFKQRSVVSVMVGKRGKPRIYKTPEDFRKAVEMYFESITREKKLTEWVDSGKRTNNGKPIMVERDVIGLDGQPVMVFDYIVPPTMPALLLSIGVSKTAWHDYRGRDGYAEVCADAKLRIEAYLAEQAVIRDNPRGVMFTLENNYGWRSSQEVELGDKTRAALAQDMTMAEKMALIRSAAAAAEAEADDDDEDGESGD